MFIKENFLHSIRFGNNFVKNIFIVVLNRRINVLIFLIGVLAGRLREEQNTDDVVTDAMVLGTLEPVFPYYLSSTM